VTEEERLVEKAKRDPAAFGLLYERYVDQIYTYIFYRTGNHHDAEDLTARTFYQALGHIRHYSNRGRPFSAWLYRIAHNLVANWHRDRTRRPTVSLDDPSAAVRHKAGADSLAEAQDDAEALRRAISRLAPERQELLVLKFGEGLSNAAIGKVMGRSESAIKSLYHRTLMALRDELEKLGYKKKEEERR